MNSAVDTPPDRPGQDPSSDLASVSVRRPILILVLNLLIAIAGFAALLAVEVRELPDVDLPVVSVRGHLPGASPETMDAEVTSIIEGAVSRVTGIRNIRSSSEENNFRIHIEFLPGIELDGAAADVREAVNQAQRELPEDVEQLMVVKAEQDAEPVLNIAVTSGTLREESLTRIIEKDIVPSLIAIPGVADVALFGQRQRIMRVELNPLRLSSLGLSVEDVIAVLRQAPLDVPSGSFRSTDQELLVRADASTLTEEQVRDIIIKGTIRVEDVAYVTFGPEDAESLVYLDAEPVIGLGVIRQAQSNTIDISAQVKTTVAELNQRLDDVTLTVTEDKAIFIKGSVKEVLVSLVYTILIVVATIWLFFGSMRSMLVPAAVIPVALIGTLAGIWLMGFSLNILTLLAIVLAAGLVVDDAIVVLENIQRRRSQGLGPRAAAVLGTRQVIFAVIATTAVLVSVFVPIALLPGSAGRLFREFGLVLATAVIISSFVALTLVPAMSARLLRTEHSPGAIGLRLAASGKRLADFYAGTLGFVLRHRVMVFVMAMAIALGAGLIYLVLGKELLPEEDRGVLYVDATGPDGTGLNYIKRQADHMEAILRPLRDSGDVENFFTIVGRYDPNRARVMVPLIPWDDRDRSQQQIKAEYQDRLARIPGAQIRISSPNSLNMRGAGGGIDVALLGSDYAEIYEASKHLMDTMAERLPHLTQTDISYRPTQPQLSVEIDRRRAADLDVPLEAIASTLRVVVAGLDIGDLNVADEAVPIMLQAPTTTLNSPQDLVNLYVKSNSGQLIPLVSLVTLKEESVAAQLDRHAQRRAIEVSAQLPPGYPLASAIEELETLATEILPAGITLRLLGEAETLNETSGDVALTYAIAFLVVFLVLSAQFEGFTSALIVIAIVPFGLAAAVYALFLTGTTVNIFSQIGLVMMIGLMAKNGILMVEFADQLRDRGLPLLEATTQAAQVRLRPIAMTMLSTVLGGLPLILSTGPGAEARSAIGWVMFGGLGLAALFTLYLTPVVYLALGRFHKPRAAESQRLDDELQAAGNR